MKTGFILIVENKKEFRDKIMELFTPDMAMLDAADGEEALEMLDENPQINCVISAVRMLKMDGLDLIKTTRQKKNKVPFILVTSYASEEQEREVKDLGAFALLEKPLDYKKLVETVHQAIEISPD